ncbi:MAG: hypothetical protein UR46_C0004G0002 [Parcubacteria group bacterium GW2011_GWA1_33_6]|uniref:Uncharacterized protein n=1 Tax=Candidatus Staskawiczbacteria bacterium RIFCSPHIGHO2_02_FULL_33_16 TaxID=1802204 RepID=A0A1G2HYN4_9BACT|nr:MAG: hypothetical protein UR31_C0001G0050 [Parcubacteria group bacterium GW2011_GWA2_33_14]KKP55432.1 MAG: hypothetical protein UR46_C0004G0002 [Parcubacteria group bacterium GW2011_GWA1_33_6]OGZ66928.1 MAG: hypothetical protein A3D34_02070 [Candidatus Staskawiczbacteria bacterium RIFCSPHIGHO2_02_FULL_33_16]OGZ70844.1 MAG: hypothetical protein A2980_02340 [Candidatus Staskawiczbacteria bacterium RIFCSPLOWO2_01_FULL_33_13]
MEENFDSEKTQEMPVLNLEEVLKDEIKKLKEKEERYKKLLFLMHRSKEQQEEFEKISDEIIKVKHNIANIEKHR